MRLALLVIASEIVSLGGFASFAAVLPELSLRWQLSGAAAGWISGAYFAGYVLAVPFLVGLTDRVSSRSIYLASCLIGALAGVGFAWGAHDVVTATLYRALAGASLAGTYMPGLRLLTERLGEAGRLRVVPYYTASFGIGVSLSFVLCSGLAGRFGWPSAFLIGGAGCLLAGLLAALATLNWPPNRSVGPLPARRSLLQLLDPRPVIANRGVVRYIAAYGGHCWELFALRAWMLPLLAFAWSRAYSGSGDDSVAWWTSAIVLTGVPASILGAEAALKLERRQVIGWAAWGSVGLGLALALVAGSGFGTTGWFWSVVAVMTAYNVAVAADSGALTAGVVAHARPDHLGSTLALHSIAGFGGGVLGPFAVGLALDLGGGLASPLAWGLAVAAMAAGSLLAALVLAAMTAARDGGAD